MPTDIARPKYRLRVLAASRDVVATYKQLTDDGWCLRDLKDVIAMRLIGLAELDLAGKRNRLVSPASSGAKQMVEALGISELARPEPKSPRKMLAKWACSDSRQKLSPWHIKTYGQVRNTG